MKKLTAALLFVLLLPPAIYADFARSEASLHPSYPGSGPFIIEISGIWPSDCHPGEQRPVVKSFDGFTVEIEFEIVVVHITCNDTETFYTSLVDMTDALSASSPQGEVLDVRVDFQGATLQQSLDLVCPVDDECNDPNSGQPLLEKGLYVTPARAREGLLVARQNGATVMYPLVYNDSGNAAWLFSAGHVLEDTYFADLSLWTGGDCFDCEPTGAQPDMTPAGHLSVLIESPSAMQVKVNERPFFRYHRLVYGYDVFQLGPLDSQPLVDLQGRWALSENHGTDPPLGDLSNFLPPAFNIVFESATRADGDLASVQQVSYLITTVTGEELGQLFCNGNVAADEMGKVCEFIDATDQSEPLLLFYPNGPSSLSIEYGRPVIAIGTPPGGKAVRLD